NLREARGERLFNARARPWARAVQPSRTEQAYRAAVALRIDVVDPHSVAGANAYARLAIRGRKRSKYLHHLPIEFDRDESVPFGVEVRRRPRLVADAALERERRRRLELEEKVRKRRHHAQFEHEAARRRERREHPPLCHAVQGHPGGAESKEHAEQRSRR